MRKAALGCLLTAFAALPASAGDDPRVLFHGCVNAAVMGDSIALIENRKDFELWWKEWTYRIEKGYSVPPSAPPKIDFTAERVALIDVDRCDACSYETVDLTRIQFMSFGIQVTFRRVKKVPCLVPAVMEPHQEKSSHLFAILLPKDESSICLVVESQEIPRLAPAAYAMDTIKVDFKFDFDLDIIKCADGNLRSVYRNHEETVRQLREIMADYGIEKVLPHPLFGNIPFPHGREYCKNVFLDISHLSSEEVKSFLKELNDPISVGDIQAEFVGKIEPPTTTTADLPCSSAKWKPVARPAPESGKAAR